MSDYDRTAARLGLRATARREQWRGSCPACRYPSSFTMTVSRGRLLVWCASCQDRKAVWRAVGPELPSSLLPPAQDLGTTAPPAWNTHGRREFALALWERALPGPSTPVATYLASRCLEPFSACEGLRYSPAARHPNGPPLPAMLALVTDVDDIPLAVHRTYLRADGSGKADVDPQKASLGSICGGAIRLAPPAEKMVVAEGIETAASAGMLLDLPAWSAVSAGNMSQHLRFPPIVKEIVIAADADRPGEAAAEAAAARWCQEGRTVQIARPKRAGADFNDILMERRNGR